MRETATRLRGVEGNTCSEPSSLDCYWLRELVGRRRDLNRNMAARHIFRGSPVNLNENSWALGHGSAVACEQKYSDERPHGRPHSVRRRLSGPASKAVLFELVGVAFS